MLRRLRPRSAYDVIAAIAFFIAVAGGSAYAAATIGSGNIKNNAVLSRHIKNGEVKNADLANNSIGTGKVADGSLLKQDFKAGQLQKGDAGAPGPGATEFNFTAPAGTNADSPTVEGLFARVNCTSAQTDMFIAVSPASAVQVGVSGLAVAGNVFSQVTSLTAGYYQLTKTANDFDLDVIARNVSVNKWTHFVLGTHNDHTGNGCGFWGQITPPSN